MRIIRNDDHHDDDGHDHGDKRQPKRLGDMVANLSADQVTDILADEFTDFLTAAVHYVDNHTPPSDRTFSAPTAPEVTPAAAPQDSPEQAPAPSQAPAAVEQPPAAAAGLGRSPMLRAAVGGSSFVVAAAVLAAWGQPATVTVPITALGAGWVAYLWWNAALRPPLPQVLSVILTAISHGLAHIAQGAASTVRRGVHRADTARTRSENRRTATA